MIAVKSLTKKFSSHVALDNLNFTIGSGSIFGLIGSNGAGKSTLLRTIAGIYQPDGGGIEIDGISSYENPAVKARIFFISDFPYFFAQSTLKEMARFYKRLYSGWDDTRYQQLCATFPICQSDKIVTMSKGMQRQAALILALSTCPDYLLMDEIFDGLDPVIRQLLKRIIAEEVGTRGVTVVIASHNLRELEDVCDHVGLLHHGGILFERELDDLKLGIHKVQAAYLPLPEKSVFDELDIVKYEARGSLVNFVIRGEQDEILEKLKSFHPVFIESLPLTLEEVFISEMEVAGYDIDNIVK